MTPFSSPDLLEERARLLRVTAYLAEVRGEARFAESLRRIASRLDVRAEARRIWAEVDRVVQLKRAA